jgi:hypothetical protein
MNSRVLALGFFMFVFANQSALAFEEKLSCTESDQSHIHKDNHAFAEALYNNSHLSGLDKAGFMNEYKGLSDECAGCYERMTKCSINHCMGRCMFSPRGEKCRDCAHEKCGAPLETCIGKPRTQSPDFDRS